MIEVKLSEFGNGKISYVAKIDPEPETRETKGDVTVINGATKGQPAFFEVDFFIGFDIECDGLPSHQSLWLKFAVPNGDDSSPYRAIEDRAAQLVAPTLRVLADKIDEATAQTTARLNETKKAKEPSPKTPI